MTKQKPVSPGVRARAEAARRLVRVSDDGAYASLVGGPGGRAEDERAVTRYVGGVTRWRRWLDHLIAASYRGRLDDMEPLLREILRIGAYDLAIRSTAPHAAVNEAVETARHVLRPGAAKLANAVLRAIDRKRGTWSTGLDESAADLAVRFSHPDWLVERWLGRFGPEATIRLLEHNNAAPVYSLRVTGERAELERRLAEAGVAWQPSEWLDNFVRVKRLQPVIRQGLLGDLCMVQDESAGLVVRLLDPQPGEHVVDACAAPGGKSAYIADRVGAEGRLTAVDVSSSRLALLDTEQPGVTAVEADFREWAASAAGTADRVLVDVPCTGLGVLASRPDMRWRRGPEDFAVLDPLQRELLHAAAGVVRPGGVLVYSTCSIAPEENAALVEGFLAGNGGFQLEDASEFVPPGVVEETGYLATLPHVHGVDGAFAARMRRLGG